MKRLAPGPDRSRHLPQRQAAIARVGDISFLNCAPIRWGLADSGAVHTIERLAGSPEHLAAQLLAGRLDISPVSLVQYLEHPEELLLLPGLAIGSDGPVQSCHLVSSRPLKDLDGRGVALSTTSRTTVLLVRMLLEDAVGVRPVYRPHRQDLDAMLSVADAAVLIGDDALRLGATGRPDLTVHDAGAMWRTWSGLPMVFAVWAVRRAFAVAHPDRVRAVHAALTDALERARRSPEAVVTAAARESALSPAGGLDEALLARYYRALDYSFGARQLAAIREFTRRAAARGALPADVRPRFVPGLEPVPGPPHVPALGGQL